MGDGINIPEKLLFLTARLVVGEMTDNTVAEVFGLSYINDLAFLVVEIVYPGHHGQLFELFGRQVDGQVLVPAIAFEHDPDVFEPAGFQYLFKKLYGRTGVSACTVAVGDGDAQVLTDIAETITRGARKGLAAKPDGAEFFTIQFEAAGFQLVFDKRVIEIDVMRDENGVFKPVVDKGRYLIKIRGTSYHFIGDAGENLYIAGDGNTGPDEGLITFKLPVSIV
jgi:hypothetical protein